MAKNFLISFLSLICLSRLTNAQTCRVLAMSGGGSFGAYEAGAFAGVVANLPAQEVTYNSAVGISAGSLNSLLVSMFPQGQEQAASAFMKSAYINFNGSSNVYVDWPGGIIDGILLQRGLYDDKPLKDYMTKLFTGIKRNITVGTVNLNDGGFYNFNETVGNVDIIEAALCSASIPGFFPFQEFMGKNFVDGGTLTSIDIGSAINRCYDVIKDYTKITIDMFSCHHHDLNTTDKDLKSFEVLSRAEEIKKYDKGMQGLYWALSAFPQVNFRYYIMPSVSLGTIPLNFTSAALEYNWQLGYKDATNVIKNKIFAKEIMDQYLATNKGVIKETIHMEPK